MTFDAETTPHEASAYELQGSASRGVLLIHGLTGVPAEMKYLAKQFNSAGYTVRVPLLAGHAAGAQELKATSWRDWLASVVTAYDDLAARVDHVSVAGICMGGMLGVALAAERPSVRALVAYSPTFAHDGWSIPKWCVAWPVLKHLIGLPWVRDRSMPEAPPYGIKNKRLRDRVERALKSGGDAGLDCFPMGALYHQYALSTHVARVAARVKAPALIVHSVDDDQSHPRNAEKLARLLSASAPIAWLHDSYHMIHVDQERAEVARLTLEFLRLVDPLHVENPNVGTLNAARLDAAYA